MSGETRAHLAGDEHLFCAVQVAGADDRHALVAGPGFASRRSSRPELDEALRLGSGGAKTLV